MREQIQEKMMERLKVIFPNAEITEETKFESDLNAKSIQYSQITTFLEDAFDVEIPYMKFRRKETVGEAIDFVLELCEEL